LTEPAAAMPTAGLVGETAQLVWVTRFVVDGMV
jgi:hypothetical protein